MSSCFLGAIPKHGSALQLLVWDPPALAKKINAFKNYLSSNMIKWVKYAQVCCYEATSEQDRQFYRQGGTCAGSRTCAQEDGC